MIGSLLGANIALKLVFFVGMAVVVGDFIAAVFTIIYQRFIYKKRRAEYDERYAPRCSIVVPCKGIPKNFGDNLRGFLQLDYPDFEVIYVVEDAGDAAVPEIKKILGEDARAKFAVAGLATECAQKNYNMLAALREVSDDSEVFVFADSDIKPARHWLREIVLPLQDPRVTVTTGFRWLLSSTGSIGELCHAYVNIFIYTCFCAACYFGGVGLWGGTMAIKRKDFEELGVAKKWSKAAVDDMSLSALVLKSRKKAVVVPACLTVTDDLLPTVGSTILWFERQIMYLKSYQRPLWLVTLPIAAFTGALICLLPIAAVGSLVSANHSFASLGGWGALFFILSHTVVAMLYPAMGKMPYYRRFLILQPLLRLMQMVSYFKTWTTKTINWAGIKYQLSYNGDVKTLKRQIRDQYCKEHKSLMQAKCAVFASGGGSNFQTLIDKKKSGDLHVDFVLMIGNNSGAKAFERAKANNIPALHIAPSHFEDEGSYAKHLLDALKDAGTEIITLAGYMKKLPSLIVREYRDKIINIHPALLPAFGGRGMYGMNVHRAVLEYGAKLSGITVHFVDEEYDQGPVILQKAVPVLEGDDEHSLAARVLEAEHENYWRAVEAVAAGRVKVEGRRVVLINV